MNAGVLQAMPFQRAVERYLSIRLPFHPATLHPAYVAADAGRDAVLQPHYLCFEQQGECWMHSVHVTSIAGTALKDATSPYGYGGPLCSTNDAGFIAAAWQAYEDWMAAQRVVVEFVRFHPVLGNERFYRGTVTDNRVVVWMDLGVDDLNAAYAQRLRQGLNKAGRAGLIYRECPLAAEVHQFGVFYRAAMAEIGADRFFLFDDSYFQSLAASGLARLGLCEVAGADGWLAASLFLDGEGLREYHLSATTAAGRAVAAASLVLHEAALAARGQGLARMYLGGGSNDKPDNPLLFFKSAYSPDRLHYRTGGSVFSSTGYDVLKELFPSEWADHPERPIFYRKV
ncbi:MAG: hypothetical protein NVS3B2_02270 [Ramlibacter sp.]